MFYPRDGDRFVSIFDLRGLDNVTMRAYERHHLSGTPFNIHGAIELVAELVAVQMSTASDDYDSDLLSTRIEEEVEDYLSEDGEAPSLNSEIFNRMVDQSFRAIDQLWGYLSPVITDAIDREYEFDCNHLYFDVSGTELLGYSALSMCLEFSARCE